MQASARQLTSLVTSLNSPQQLYKALQKASAKKPEYINVADNYLQGLMMGVDEAGKMQQKELSAEQKKEYKKKAGKESGT